MELLDSQYRLQRADLRAAVLGGLVIVHREHARDDGRKIRPLMNKHIDVSDISCFADTGSAVCEPGRTCLTGGSRPWRGLRLFSAAERRRFLLPARPHWVR
jgi:hypothetical protein